MLGALIGGAFNLFGANKAKKAEEAAIRRQNEYNKPINIRARAEEAGINPALFFGPGVGNQVAVGGSNYMGQAIAESGMMLADALSRRKDAGQVSQLQAQNRKLNEQVQRLTLRPTVPGIYGANRVAAPSIPEALNGGPALSRPAYGDTSPSWPSGSSVPHGPLSGVTSPESLNWQDADIASSSDDASRVPQKPLYVMGMELPPTSGSSDAEAVGSRYGEDFGSPAWFTGWGSFLHDSANAMAWRMARGRMDGSRVYRSTYGGTRPPPRRGERINPSAAQVGRMFGFRK